MKCSLPPHVEGLPFLSYQDYEAHYAKAHTNRCLECRKNFPSEHLLGVHIEECHDSLAAVRRERGEHTYSCFVEDCERKCRTPQKRRMHMIDKHGYPANYFFALTKEGVDGRRSLLLEGGHRRRSSSGIIHSSPNAAKDSRRRSNILDSSQEVHGSELIPTPVVAVGAHAKAVANSGVNIKADEAGEGAKVIEGRQQDNQGNRDVDMEDLAGAMSSLQFIPTSVRFGRGGKLGFAKN